MSKVMLVIAATSGILAFPAALYNINAAIVLVIIGVVSFGFSVFTKVKRY
jgi:hypothetical protein